MNLGLLFSIGGSIQDYKNNGQLKRLIEYLESYKLIFNKIYIFSYANECENLPSNCILVPNKHNIHRYLYTFLLPFIQAKEFKNSNILKVTQMTGSTPAVISKLLYKIPYISTYGFDYFSFAKTENQGTISKLINIFMPVWIKFSDCLIVTNKIILEKLKIKGLSSKLAYIPNGVDTSLFKPVDHKISTETIKILSVGRLVKQKNLGLLVEAINKSKFNNRIKLTIVGEGPEKQYLDNLAKKLNVDLTILPFCPLEILYSHYKNNNLFILPSLIEGHPKVLLESLSVGLPTIASNVEGVTEIITDNENGLLFDPSSEVALSEKIDLLISDQVLAGRLSDSGKKCIKKYFSLKNLLSKENQLLNKYVLSEKAGY